MRTFQLSAMVKSRYGRRYTVGTMSNKSIPKNSVCILVKMAILDSKETYLRLLKKRNNILIYDPVDGRIPEDKIKLADAIIASSLQGYWHYKNPLGIKWFFS